MSSHKLKDVVAHNNFSNSLYSTTTQTTNNDYTPSEPLVLSTAVIMDVQKWQKQVSINIFTAKCIYKLHEVDEYWPQVN